MDLAELTLESIQAHLGTTFEVPLPDGKTTMLKLDAVLPFESRQRRPTRTRVAAVPKREAFSMYLLGDPAMVLPQGMYTLRSESLTLDGIFIVPVGQDDQATEYEAVFT